MSAMHLPAPYLIRRECDAIRSAWSTQQLQRRAMNAERRQAELVALLEATPSLPTRSAQISSPS